MGVSETPLPGRCREPLGPDGWKDAATITVPAQEERRHREKQLPMVKLYLAAVAIVCVFMLEVASMLVHSQNQAALSIGRHLEASGPSSSGGSTSSGSGCAQEAHHSNAFEPVLFFLLAYLCSAVAQELMLFFPENLRVPHSVNLFLLGMLLAQCSRWIPSSEFGHAIRDFQSVDPHIIFWVLLPAILYEDSSNVNWYVMKKVLPSCILLAIPGVILNSLLTGFLIKSLFGTVTWTWDSAFLLGSILSATDPVAVMGALHELQAPDKLSHLVSGESLVNDGSAVVVFHLFWDSARRIRELTPGYSVGFFLRLACGGPALGFAAALMAFQWLKRTRTFTIEILVILAAIYGGFFVSEHSEVKVSGVLAVVVFGFFMAAHGHFSLNIDEEQRHEAILHFIALLSNEAIFVLAGVVSFRFIREGAFSGQDWLELIFLYFIVHFTRAFIMILFWPLLKRWGYGLKWKEGLICVFGGLRGAVGLALALLVEFDTRMTLDIRSRIAFHTSGIVLGTLIINGTFITTLYKKLHIYAQAEHHEKLLIVALKKADALTRKRVAAFEQHWFFHNCVFSDVWRLVPSLSESAHPPPQSGPSSPHSIKRQSTMRVGPRISTSSRVSKASKATVASRTSRKGFSPQLTSNFSWSSQRSKFFHVNAEHWSMKQEVNDIMTCVARKVGSEHDNLETHFMKKIRNRRRKGAAFPNNIFLLPALPPHDHGDDSHHEVIELALQMLRDDLKKATFACAETDAAITSDDARRMSIALELTIDAPLTPHNMRESMESRMSDRSMAASHSMPISEASVVTGRRMSGTNSMDSKHLMPMKVKGSEKGRDSLAKQCSTGTWAAFESEQSYHAVQSMARTESNMSKVCFQISDGKVAPAGDEAFTETEKKRVRLAANRRESDLGMNSAGLDVFLQEQKQLLRASSLYGTLDTPASPSSFSPRKSANDAKIQKLFSRMGALQELRKRAHARAKASDALATSKSPIKPVETDDVNGIYTSAKSKAVAGLLQDAGTMVKTLTETQGKAIDLKDIIARAMGNKIVAWVERKDPKEVQRMSGHNRALYRWRYAIQRIMWALRKVFEAQTARQRLWDEIENDGRGNAMRFTMSTGPMSKDDFIEDAHSMEEIFLTVLNAQRASYVKMFEARALGEHTYRILMDATEYQEEAIYGELRSLPFKPDGDLLDPRLRWVNRMNHQEQMALSFAVGWQYISDVTDREVRRAMRCNRWMPCLVSGEWWMLRRDIEMILAFIVVAERILEEPVLKPFKNEVHHPLLKVCEFAKVSSLYTIMKQDPAMFVLFEHILCAKLVIGSQRRLLEDLRMEGTLNDHDTEHIMRHVLGPVQEALDDYIPTRDQLQLATSGPPRKVNFVEQIGPTLSLAKHNVGTKVKNLTQSMGFGFFARPSDRPSSSSGKRFSGQRLYESMASLASWRRSADTDFSGSEFQFSESSTAGSRRSQETKGSTLAGSPSSKSQQNFTTIFPNDLDVAGKKGGNHTAASAWR